MLLASCWIKFKITAFSPIRWYFLDNMWDNSSDRVLKMVHTIEGHIGGVKAIQFVSSQEINNNLQGYFISCGSRTSLKCWKIGFNFGQNFACSPLSEIYNPESKAKDKIFKSDDVIDDMRYMDCSCFLLSKLYKELEDCICIICACSDGMARWDFRPVLLSTFFNIQIKFICRQVSRCSLYL